MLETDGGISNVLNKVDGQYLLTKKLLCAVALLFRSAQIHSHSMEAFQLF